MLPNSLDAAARRCADVVPLAQMEKSEIMGQQNRKLDGEEPFYVHLAVTKQRFTSKVRTFGEVGGILAGPHCFRGLLASLGGAKGQGQGLGTITHILPSE